MFDSFKRRSAENEIMDDPNVGYDDFRDCLRDLESVNKLTFAYRPTLRWMQQVLKRTDCVPIFSVLDAGCGGGDTLRVIGRKLRHSKVEVRLTGVDLNPWSRRYAQSCNDAGLPITFETGDVFDYAKDQKIDFIISALFTHHLDDDRLVAFLRWMERRADKGWFITDLHRHPIAFYGFRLLSRWLGFHYMVRHDGPISVARAFKKGEWLDLLERAGIARDQVEIKWFFPFRYCLTRHKA